jgi:hypothetical protein
MAQGALGKSLGLVHANFVRCVLREFRIVSERVFQQPQSLTYGAEGGRGL